MERAARLVEGVVVEVLVAPEGVRLSDCFHSDILANSVPCGDDAQLGWVYVDGQLYDPANPPAPPQPVEEPVEAPAASE
jgi:hypothetical protein